MRNVIARRWSAITRIETSDGSSSVAPVRPSGALADGVEDRREEVGVVVRDLALDHRGDPLEAHAGVDRRRRQRVERPVALAVELHEHVVPDLDVAIAAAVDAEAGLAGALLFARDLGAAIVVDLGAAAARARFAHLPEVLRQPELGDPRGRDELRPDRRAPRRRAGCPPSPLKMVGNSRSAGRFHSFVSISQANGMASRLK